MTQAVSGASRWTVRSALVAIAATAVVALVGPGTAVAAAPTGVTTISVPGASKLTFVAYDAANDEIYAVDRPGSAAGIVDVLDAKTEAVVATIPVGVYPTGIAVDSATNTIAVASRNDSTVTLVDGATNAVTGQVSLPAPPLALAYDDGTATLWVFTRTGLVSIVGGAVASTAPTPLLGGATGAIAVDPQTHTVYLGYEPQGTTSGAVATFAPGATAATATIAFPEPVTSLVLDPATGRVYAGQGTTGSTVGVLDRGATSAGTPIALQDSWAAGGGSQYFTPLALDPATGLLVGPSNAGLTGVDPATGRVRGIPIDDFAVAFDSTGRIWSVRADATVDVFDGTSSAPTAPLQEDVSGTTDLVTSGYRSLQVAWFQPEDLGWSDLLGFAISVDGGAPVATVSPTTTTYTVTGLLAGTHEIRVGAVTSSGTVWDDPVSGDPGVTETLASGLSNPWGVATDPGAGVVYVVEAGSPARLDKLDELTGAVLGTLTVGSGYGLIAVDSKTHTVYVPNADDGTVSIVDGSSMTVTATVAVGAKPDAVAFDPSTRTAYVANDGDGTMSAIRDGAVVATTPVGGDPWALAVDPTTHVVYVAHGNANDVSAVDPESGATLWDVGVGGNTGAIAVDPATHHVFATVWYPKSVVELDGATGTIIATDAIYTGYPDGIALDARTDTLFVVGIDTVGTESGITVFHLGGSGYHGAWTVATDANAVAVDWQTHLAFSTGSLGGVTTIVGPGTPLVPLVQGIDLTAPSTGTVGTTATLAATGGDSGNPVTFSVDASSGAGVCSVSGSTVSYLAPGSCVVDADQAGNDTYAAGHAQATIAVTGKPQTIAFTAPATATAGGTLTLSATGGGSGNPVVFSVDASSDAGVCSVSGSTLDLLAAGSCVVDANQAGGAGYTAAPQVQQTIAVALATQTIAFTAPATGTAGQTATLTATGGGSGNPVVFSVDASSDAGVCSISGSTVTYLAAGSCVVDADQAGTAAYAAAAQVQRTIAVSPPDTTPPVLTVPAAKAVDATGPDGAVVTFAATATDNVDPSPRVSCSPASGSTFAIGDTTVSCTATDASGNVARATFLVHVRGAKEQLDAAIALTRKLVARRGHARLTPVLVELVGARLARKGKLACLSLALATRTLEREPARVLDPGDRQTLLDDVARIEKVLGC